jgi:GxxExxY protein
MGDEKYVDEDMEPDPELNRITNGIIGCCIAVHRALGPGHPESIYHNSLAIEFRYQGVPFEEEKIVPVFYRGVHVGEAKLDFLVRGKVVLELKSVEEFHATHPRQVVFYLRATGSDLGLLINFNVKVLVDGIRRIANTHRPS